MKHNNDIQELLDRYINGETTLQEELELREYFSSGNVDPDLHAERDMFNALAGLATPPGLEERLNETIDRLADTEQTRRFKLQRFKTLAARIAAVAACAALIVTLALPHRQSDEEILSGMTPQEVAMHTTKALELMARTINNGAARATDATFGTIENINQTKTNNL